MVLLSGCATTVTSAKAICEIERPTLTEEELSLLSDQSVIEIATYFKKLERGCYGVDP